MRFSIDRDYLRGLAYCFMILGHVLHIWWPSMMWLRIPLEVCLPIFCWLGVVGLRYSSNVERFILGVLVLAVVSQWPYRLAFGVEVQHTLNDMFGLSWGLLVCAVYRHLGKLWPVLVGVWGAYSTGLTGGVECVLVCYAVNELYQWLPVIRKGQWNISKLWVYGIYPAHLLLLGFIRWAVTDLG